jgi:hypothetical protein
MLGRGEASLNFESELLEPGYYSIGPLRTDHAIVQLQHNPAHRRQLGTIEQLPLRALSVHHQESWPNLLHHVVERLSGDFNRTGTGPAAHH